MMQQQPYPVQPLQPPPPPQQQQQQVVPPIMGPGPPNHRPSYRQQQQQPQQPQPQQLQPPPFNNGVQSSNNNNNPLTLKIILSRDEVAYLFGFDGLLINQLRQQTSANINLTEGDAPERVLMIQGTLELIFKAFSLICRKLWDFISSMNAQQPNLVLRLAVPASQCGSIIGKQGAKVKEIRDITGSNIQVSQESLPDSTERCVEISGNGESCLQCTYHICCVLQEAPLRGEIIPYIPKGPSGGGGRIPMPPQVPLHEDDWKPVFLCRDKAYVIDGNVARLAPPELLRKELGKTAFGAMAENLGNYQGVPPDHMNPLSLMTAIGNAQRNNGSNSNQTSKDMSVPADFVGSVIGKGGQKIAEIRRMSGAQVHINHDDDISPDGTRIITLTGSPESILLAQFLIQSTIDMTMKERAGGVGVEDFPGNADGVDNFSNHDPTVVDHHQQHSSSSRRGFGGGGSGSGGGGPQHRGHGPYRNNRGHRDGGGRRSPSGRPGGGRRGGGGRR